MYESKRLFNNLPLIIGKCDNYTVFNPTMHDFLNLFKKKYFWLGISAMNG